MPLSADDIKALIADFNASDWDEMSLVAGDVSVVISRSGPAQLGPMSTRPDTAAVAPVDAAEGRAQPPPGPGARSPSHPTSSETVGAPEPAGTAASHEVTSPTVGLFWRSPQPGSPPFVEEGQHVEPDDTVCIIEVMKLLSHVKADVSGRIASIQPENGALVEYGTVLMRIAPDD